MWSPNSNVELHTGFLRRWCQLLQISIFRINLSMNEPGKPRKKSDFIVHVTGVINIFLYFTFITLYHFFCTDKSYFEIGLRLLLPCSIILSVYETYDTIFPPAGFVFLLKYKHFGYQKTV